MTFVVFGPLRVDKCEFQFTFGHKFHEMAHVCAAQTTNYMYLSQDLTEGTFWQQKSKVRYLQKMKDLAIVNDYRKFEEIIFTNNKDMSV